MYKILICFFFLLLSPQQERLNIQQSELVQRAAKGSLRNLLYSGLALL